MLLCVRSHPGSPKKPQEGLPRLPERPKGAPRGPPGQPETTLRTGRIRPEIASHDGAQTARESTQ
eukprot:9376259-Pyramimonas_sp.AAC.1